MLTEYINSIAKLGVGRAFEARFGDGRFTMVNKTMAHVKMGALTYSSNLELSTHFQVSGFKYSTVSPLAHNKFYGYNKRYLDEDGVYDPVRAIDEFSKTVPGLRLTKTDLVALANTSNVTDSHEAFIYTMLVSWYKARLYKDMNGKDDKIRIKHSGYSDSHVNLSMHGQTTEIETEVELGPLVEVTPDMLGWVQRGAENYWAKPYVLRYTSTNIPQTTFYLIHTLGSSGASALNVDIPVPALDAHETLLDGVGGMTYGAFDESAIPWGKPEVLWLWIMDYVRLNRVEQAFAAALELLGSIAAQPTPSYQESVHWDKAVLTVNLARFSPTRARIPSNLLGEPNVYDLNASALTMDSNIAPQNFLAISSVLNYISWVGLYGLIDNFATDLSDWRAAFVSHSDELGILNTVDARAALISLVTGKEIITCMSRNCYLSYDLTAMANSNIILAASVNEPDYDPIIRLDTVPAYVSGSLILGAVACDIDSLAHLHSTQTFEVDRYGTASVQDAIKIANVYRLFGHQVTLTHERSGEVFPVYANTSDAVIASYEVLARTRPFDKLMIRDSEARAGRHDMIPSASGLFQYGLCHITVEMPKLDITAWKNRSNVYRPTVILSSRRKAVVFKVANTSEFTQTKFMVSNKRDVARQDFYDAQVEPAPSIPVAGPQAAVMQTMEAGAEADPAETAE
uniref:Putative coat protein n=1 Tax=Plasmopara viticola lesion associated toti 4 TaxID=2689135 RepID=A0A6B9HDD2_9VIRU|nr:putative coat protein [Plasmopara viticola lesion associated toti 4]